MASDPYNLKSRSKEELVVFVSKLLQKLNQKDRTEFISKFISAQVALEEMGEDNPSDFIKKVEAFCTDCLARKYFVDPYDEENYNRRADYGRHDYYHDDDVPAFEESEWADQFSELFNLAIIHARNKAFTLANKAFDLLLDCLEDASNDESILGTDSPMDYIEIDWKELFKEKYNAMKHVIKDPTKFAVQAIDVWLAFGVICTESLVSSFTEIEFVEVAIIQEISERSDEWLTQRRLYDLLKTLYVSLDLTFNDIDNAQYLLEFNQNFALDLAEGYIQAGKSEEALLAINNAIPQIFDKKLIYALNQQKINSLESLGRLNEAYDLSYEMYLSHYHHELYIRARGLALKTCGLTAFVDQVSAALLIGQRYEYQMPLLRVYSYEGDTQKLIDTVTKSAESSRYYSLEFASQSLLYRAIGRIDEPESALKEYLDSIEAFKVEGVIDMIRQTITFDEKKHLILSAIGLIKGLVQLNINGADRYHYAKAAAFAAVIRDLFDRVDQRDDFNQYYKRIIIENSRRPALKDEFKRKLGH